MSIDNFIINRENSALIVIDIQERLFVAMEEKIQNNILKNTGILIETANVYDIPIIVSEQYKKGLGPTMKELAEKINDTEFLEKLHFDCMKDESLKKTIFSTEKNTLIIAGMETHVCVFQTALTLLKSGKNVIIASDAVGSRRKHDWKTALSALSAAGAVICPTETISFMILEKAGTTEFKKLAPLFK
jgi:nicotinamidase-related amidase